MSEARLAHRDPGIPENLQAFRDVRRPLLQVRSHRFDGKLVSVHVVSRGDPEHERNPRELKTMTRKRFTICFCCAVLCACATGVVLEAPATPAASETRMGTPSSSSSQPESSEWSVVR